MWRTAAMVSLGGVIGSLARYGLSVALPTAPGGFPWSTWLINVSGSALIGVLMAVSAARSAPQWVRPMLGIGVLGGYTTFSGYAVDALGLLDADRPWLAGMYLFTTVIAALAAVLAASVLTRKVLRARS